MAANFTGQGKRRFMTSLARPGGPVDRALQIRAIAVRTASQQRIRANPRRIDTGNLINSIQIETIRHRGFPAYRIGTNVYYALYVHDGTQYMEGNPYLKDGLRNGLGKF